MSPAATISVVIPTRDRPALLASALESVRRQTRSVDQIVVVDDGSSPEHAERIRTIAASVPAIDLVRRAEPGGPAAARNLGLGRARGSHLVFLDDDDLLHPRFCEAGLEALANRPDADVVVFRYECFFAPRSFDEELPVAMLFDYRNLAEHPLRKLDSGNPAPAERLESRPISAFLRFLIPVHAGFVRREAIGDVRFPDELPQGEDTVFWIRLAAGGRRFVSRPEVYAFVRRHAGNTTRSRRRYAIEIQRCYEALLADGLLGERDDVFLAHLKLFWFRASTRSGDWARHLRRIACAPDLLARELVFWTGNLGRRRRLLRYYFEP